MRNSSPAEAGGPEDWSGLKPAAETRGVGPTGTYSVGRRCGRAEGGPKGPLDLPQVQIPAAVAASRGENPPRRKGQGFPAMVVSRELAGPKAGPNWYPPKGKGVNIPLPPG